MTQTTTKGKAMSFTLNEQKAIEGFKNGAYTFFDMGVAEGSESWSDILVDEIAGVIGKSTSSARGVFSSLVKKGIFLSGEADPERDNAHPVYLTAHGVEVINEGEADEELDHVSDELDDIDLEDGPIKVVATSGDAEAPKRTAKPKAPKRLTKKEEEHLFAKKPTGRFDHSACGHAQHGKEGKIARAKCRRDHAAAAAKAAEAAKA